MAYILKLNGNAVASQ